MLSPDDAANFSDKDMHQVPHAAARVAALVRSSDLTWENSSRGASAYG